MAKDFVDDDHVQTVALSQGEKEKLDQVLMSPDNAPLPPYWQDKYRKDQGKNWDTFYKRNEINFFKDRSWLDREFTSTEENDNDVKACLDGPAALDALGRPWKLIDIGCGVGNALFPMLTNHEAFCEAYAYDVSKRAIEFVKDRATSSGMTSRIKSVGVWDLIKDDEPSVVYKRSLDGFEVDEEKETYKEIEGQADLAMMLFVLSAIPPESVAATLVKVAKTLKKGGVLLFRDYGQYDQKEIRFAARKNAKLDDHFYVRQDGTLAVYFHKDELARLMMQAGLKVVQLEEIQRRFKNRKTGQTLDRVWLQGSFTKE